MNVVCVRVVVVSFSGSINIDTSRSEQLWVQCGSIFSTCCEKANVGALKKLDKTQLTSQQQIIDDVISERAIVSAC